MLEGKEKKKDFEKCENRSISEGQRWSSSDDIYKNPQEPESFFAEGQSWTEDKM